MNADVIRLIIEAAFIPIVVALIIWAVTQRRSDNAAIKKTLAEAGKLETEGEVAEETVEAAIQLADINTLKELIASMSQAYKEEREATDRELERTRKTADTCLLRQTELAHELDNMRADVTRYHREVLDMYRRDLYHAHAIRVLTEWIADNLPKILEAHPGLPRPPQIDPLPPLHIDPDEDLPNRRWYDQTPAVDPDDQEV
jgi:hypothetical protein